MRARGALKAAGPCLVALLAACQPQARRLLLLDLTLSDPAVLDGTALPWRDAGYHVDYRQFFPHLARRDLARYHVVVALLGREPEAPSDALTAGDLDLLHEWMVRGGVVVLGYDADGEGSLDRWTANRWLEFEGTGITIGDRLLEDTTEEGAWARARPMGDEPLGSVYDPFPLDRNHVVSARDRAQLLAVAGPHAFVRAPRAPAARRGAGIAAAARVGDGLVVVISRQALGAVEPQFRPASAPVLAADALDRTHDFLTALARWTRRPAEWAHVSPAAHGAPLAIGAAPIPVELAPPPLAPPDTFVIRLPLAADSALARATNVPDWMREQGMRALWTPLLLTSRDGHRAARAASQLDSLVTLLDVGGFNLVAGDAGPETADSLHTRWEERDAVRRAWADAVNRLQPTSVAWIPVFDLAAARWTPGDSARGPRGEALPAPCALDSTLWSESLPIALTALARLAADQRGLVIGLGLDLATRPAGGLDFCDAAWRAGLARLGRRGALDSLPYRERYATLRDAGRLREYDRSLRDEVADRAAILRNRILKLRQDLYFAFRMPALPSDAFSLGLLRGFSLPDRPLLVFTPELRTSRALAAYRSRGLDLAHAVVLAPSAVRSADWTALKRLVFTDNDGFSLAAGDGRPAPPARRLATDSLARALRRLTR